MCCSSGTATAARRTSFFKPVAIGRGVDNDVEFSDTRVSRHHAILWAEEGAWHVRDLGSANGTFIGHSRIESSTTFPPACELRFHPAGPVVSVHVDKPAQTVI